MTMRKLLVNTPTDGQQVIEVGEGGGYFDQARVLWDEEQDGPLPDITLGSMTRVGDALEYDASVAAASAVIESAKDAARVAEKIDQLWSAANAYTSGYISGLAVGVLAIGVVQQKPISLAIKAWSKSIWTEYYARKAAVTADSAVNLDFSSFGPMPHSVPELIAEVEG